MVLQKEASHFWGRVHFITLPISNQREHESHYVAKENFSEPATFKLGCLGKKFLALAAAKNGK